MNYKDVYNSWMNSSFLEEKEKEELKNIDDEQEIKDRFYKDLSFGTGGIRGIVGLGTNRINRHTVAKATQGLANYLMHSFEEKSLSVAIAYDCRNDSFDLAKITSEVLCSNGIKVYIFSDIMCTPILSYATRELKCEAGIVITASHNTSEYNGYKVYNHNGNQITDIEAQNISEDISKVKNLSNIKYMNIENAKEKDLYNFVPTEVLNKYFSNVKNLAIRKDIITKYGGDLKILYTPLHGTGNVPVRRALEESGYNNVFVVKDQEEPNGNFPTVKYPNPEDPKSFYISLKEAKNIKPDIIIATDPDCDRVGIMVKDHNEEYVALNGNQLGIILTNYILSSLEEEKDIPKNSVVLKTIVTTDMVKDICKDYGVKVEEVLTGFKYIGEKIEEFKKNGINKFIFGFEESYGYLFGDFVREKDGIISSVLICEMALYYKIQNKNLCDVLKGLYDKYGYYKERLISMEFKGEEGKRKIENIINKLRIYDFKNIFNKKILIKEDYKTGLKMIMNKKEEYINGLPKSNVLKFYLNNNTNFVVRPSGTEPKVKIYLSSVDKTSKECEMKINDLEKNINDMIKKF
ncbi:phospho-sugar mutase [Clostridium sporogenes]|uniref:Phospho-sugar mutase n=1 Tax=Clostridium botulinum TaxID=1491 RepID=A0A6M0T528_CLOBO|nr:phospho-sugar mutase [Clostridium sporogenes]NFA62275.1 phospho-sugar mutase [Clostridium botulinum]NFI75270.1 phospho-sugar mutase [Clostridium sporogenes]NFL72132.1 phospho-sugar mutase [Clostridium sporogenes]NFM24211.1 phospho-sugar mutase [Clostridium sporogenes]NFP63163.1 phospho-sugar mutase [Clostridium sporogenes]